MTQPPLSRQVAALERELGVELIERHSRKVKLTPAGAQFLIDSRAALAAVDQACRNAQFASGGELGELAIGFMMHAAYSSIPTLTRHFMAAYPAVKLQLREMVPSLLITGVLNGTLDAAITFGIGSIPGLTSAAIYEEPLCLVVAKSHRLAATALVTVNQLAGEPLIASPPDAAPTLWRSISGYFENAGLTPEIRLEAQLQQTIVNFVAEGIGIALVPKSIQRAGVGGVAFCELADAPVVNQVIAWRPGNLNPVLNRFLETTGFRPA